MISSLEGDAAQHGIGQLTEPAIDTDLTPDLDDDEATGARL